MVAGKEMAVQDKNRTAPPMTAGQAGTGKAGHGHQVEDQEGPLGPQPVGEVAPRKGVEGREEVVQAVQQADRDGAAAQGHEVDGQKALGHLLAQADQDDHAQKADHGPAQA